MATSENALRAHTENEIFPEDLLSSDGLWTLYDEYNQALNNGYFEDASLLAEKINLILIQLCGITLDSTVDELTGVISLWNKFSVFDSAQSASNLLSGLCYGQALSKMLGEKDYKGSQHLFSRSFQLLERSLAITDLELSMRHRLWRSRYHEGLAVFFAGDISVALSIFQRLLASPGFRDEFLLLEAKTSACRGQVEHLDYRDSQDVPSDVVSGVLYYSSLSLMKLENFSEALPMLRAAAVLAGNPTSAGFTGLAELKLTDCYEGLIKQKCFGNASSKKHVSVSFHNRQTFCVSTIFNAAPTQTKHSITAIVPVYNGAKLVAQTLLSVIEQTRQPDELIIIDDGSEDNSSEIIARLIEQHHFPFDIIVIKTMNGGQSQARNLGAVAATSSLLAYLDQDDLWYAEHLQMLLEPFAEKPKLGWTYSDLDEIDLAGKMIHRKFLNIVAPSRRFNTIRDLVHTDMFILPSASIISRAALLSISGFDEELSGYEDDDLFVRLFRDGFEHVFVDMPLSKWRIHQGSCSYQMRMVISRRKYQKKLSAMFPNDPAMGRFWIRDVISPRFFANGVNRFNVGIETGDYTMCAEALIDMETSMKTMVVPLRTRLRVFLCRFPSLFKRFRTLQIHSKFK